MDRGAFWQKVISEKYGEEDGGWKYRKVRDGYDVGIWKTIRNGTFFGSKVAFSMGNERKLRFFLL